MIMTKEEEAIIEKLHTLRGIDPSRYWGWVSTFGPTLDSDIERITRGKYGTDKIIRFPGTAST